MGERVFPRPSAELELPAAEGRLLDDDITLQVRRPRA